MPKYVQKILKIGARAVVIVPKNIMTFNKLAYGDEVNVIIDSIKNPDPQQNLMDDYGEFIKHYGETLKNLAGR